MRSRYQILLLALVLSVGATHTLQAQGKGKGKDHDSKAHEVKAHDDQGHANKAKGPPPGHVKRITVDDGIRSTRTILGERGYTVARVEQSGGVRTIYYYRGNNGRGRGHGPLEKIVIRPYAERVVVEGGAKDLVALVRSRLGM